MSQPYDRINVYRFGQIGDTVAALPGLRALRQHFPQSEIVLLSEIPAGSDHIPPEAVLPEKGLVNGFEKYPAGATLKNFFAARRRLVALRRRGFKTLVYLVPNERTRKQRVRDRLFFWAAGIWRMLAAQGFPAELPARLPDGMLARLPKEADALLSRLQLDRIPVPAPDDGCMDLGITPSETARAEAWWRANLGDRQISHGWIAVCTGGKTSTQLWPWERYAAVVQMLIDRHGLFPVIVGGPGDRDLGQRLVATWKTGLCAAGELSVRESAALLAGARFYLGNDTGVMHLAAAVGTPCVALFSARNPPGRWEPYGGGHQVLRFEVPCAGCGLEVCDKGLPCLLNISEQEVYDACVAMLDAQASIAAP